MNKDEKLTVTLSKRTTSISLPQDPGKALQQFMAAGNKWISWSELHDAGVAEPTEAVSELEKLGAMFKTMRKDMVTAKWEIHEDAPHYKYCGWHFDADSPKYTTTPNKETT